MPDPRRTLTRADLPDELTSETIRRLPISVLKRLARPGNGVLDADEQAAYDVALREMMSETARRVSGQVRGPEWANALRAARTEGRGRSTRADQHLQRIARRIGEQVDVAEGLAPGVDWSFAQPASAPAPEPAAEEDQSSETVSDLEQRLSDQMELVQVMSEIADVGKRTYALEQQRDLQSTRGVFFGFVVSVAVLVAGWAPLVAADDWAERGWIIALTVLTCVLAGAVYALVRRLQKRRQPTDEDQ